MFNIPSYKCIPYFRHEWQMIEAQCKIINNRLWYFIITSCTSIIGSPGYNRSLSPFSAENSKKFLQ